MINEDGQELDQCCHCGNMLPPSHFYKSPSNLYFATGHLPVCRDCFERQHIVFYNMYHDFKKAFKRMCMAYDVYFSDVIYDSCDEDGTLVGKYFRKLNIRQYQTKTFDNSLAEGFRFSDTDTRPVEKKVGRPSKEEKEKKPHIAPKDVEKWGQGLEFLDYQNLNAHYKFLKDANPNCDSNQEIFINDLCYTKMQQLRCVRQGDMDNFKKMGEYYNNTFTKSGLKVVREVETNSDDCLGLWTSRIAQYTPEEYYKDKTLYQDHDNLMDYVNRFVLRPLKNLMFGTQERDAEFCVKDDGDEDDTESDT